MNKYYVLDTNVLLHSPQSIFAFTNHTVIVPEAVSAPPLLAYKNTA